MGVSAFVSGRSNRVRILLRFSYDGTDFRGWQMQPGLPTVQQAVEEALTVLCGRKITVHSAGRTDSGVHALSMPVHLDIEEYELDRIRGGLNSKLPGSIRLLSSTPVKEKFNARFDALSRSYRYRIARRPDPFTRFYEYQPGNEDLQTDAMHRAAHLSLGKRSWKGFAKEGSDNSTWTMDVTDARVEEDRAGWSFFITADRFLRGVVRIWSGTLYRAGTGRIPPETVSLILSEDNRAQAGPSLPACGLTLMKVEYSNEE